MSARVYGWALALVGLAACASDDADLPTGAGGAVVDRGLPGDAADGGASGVDMGVGGKADGVDSGSVDASAGGAGGVDGGLTDGGPSAEGIDSGPTDSGVEPPAHTILIRPMDLWARGLPAAQLWVDGVERGALPGVGWSIPVSPPAQLSLRLEAPDHLPLEAEIAVALEDGALVVSAPSRPTEHGLTWWVEGADAQVFLGLQHAWFSTQGPAPSAGNLLYLHADGESAWASVAAAIQGAGREILLSTWWWVSDFQLVRSYPAGPEAERAHDTILGLLQDSGARARILVGELWGDHDLLDPLTWDAALRAAAADPSDRVEAMGQGNSTAGEFWFEPATVRFEDRLALRLGRPLPEGPAIPSPMAGRAVDLADIPGGLAFQIASYHQKFVVVDEGLAYVGGMNLTESDWDSSEHAIFDPRRVPFDADEDERDAVAAKDSEPEYGPSKDYMLEIDGPGARDVAQIFFDRWGYLRSEGVRYAEDTTPMLLAEAVAPRAGGVEIQITTTEPEPFWRHSIGETWLKAVAQAERYIYIEDQYWRSTLLTEAILARMEAAPDLQLVVITQPVDTWFDPACVWTHQVDQQLRARFPDRYHTFQLRGFDTSTWGIGDETEAHFVDFYLHAKMFVVDGRFMSVGSANKNNRGILYEGEMNVAVLDEAWVTAAHRRMLSLLLPPGVAPSDEGWIEQLEAAAEANAEVRAAWDIEGDDIDLGVNGDLAPLPDAYRPQGFLYPLSFGEPVDCLIESIGPDIFWHPDQETP